MECCYKTKKRNAVYNVSLFCFVYDEPTVRRKRNRNTGIARSSYRAVKFRSVGAIEKKHEERYRKLLKNIEDEAVFAKDGSAIWQCRQCGHIVVGKKAPEVCPVCAHPKSFFEVKAENY